MLPNELKIKSAV